MVDGAGTSHSTTFINDGNMKFAGLLDSSGGSNLTELVNRFIKADFKWTIAYIG